MGRGQKQRKSRETRVSFEEAQFAFSDPNLMIMKDITHSTEQEARLYCIGKLDRGIIMVRFTYRENKIRIFGAGFWRKGRRFYEQKSNS